jgi:hypothetical protein
MPQTDDWDSGEYEPVGDGWFKRWVHRAWWLHSCVAFSFGVGVMVVARKGLEFADKLLVVVGLSWLLMFIALRFIVGPGNRAPEEGLARKGVRLVTNYVIKNLYQQMFFFLVPLYASSATWSLSSWNWWLPPVLMVCAVFSTMDLVFDNFIMERRVIASLMYGLALFAVLNLMLPLVLGMRHFNALLIAAGATAPAVALLNFRVRSVFSAAGLSWTLMATAGLMGLAWSGRAFVPPAPLAMVDGTVGHGSYSSYECLPPPKSRIRADRLENLRCGSKLTEPGGPKDKVVHIWRKDGQVLAIDEHPALLRGCDGDVFRSEFPPDQMPTNPLGKWECRVQTTDGQLVGSMKFEVVAPPPGAPAKTKAPATKTAPQDAGPKGDGGAPAPKDATTPPDAKAKRDAK